VQSPIWQVKSWGSTEGVEEEKVPKGWYEEEVEDEEEGAFDTDREGGDGSGDCDREGDEGDEGEGRPWTGEDGTLIWSSGEEGGSVSMAVASSGASLFALSAFDFPLPLASLDLVLLVVGDVGEDRRGERENEDGEELDEGGDDREEAEIGEGSMEGVISGSGSRLMLLWWSDIVW
jgi:hypothetical protein